MTSLLLRGGQVLILNPAGDLLNPGYIAIDAGRITALGAGQPPAELAASAESTWDLAGHLILPGLVNAHTHLGQVLTRNLGQDRPLLEWLDRVIWPAQQATTPTEAGLAARVGLIENIRSGVTTIVDHQKLVATPAHSDAVAEAAAEMGVRFVLARAWAETGRGGEDLPAVLAELDRLRRTWHGAAEGRFQVAFGPLAPWRCSIESLRAGVQAARRWGLATHIHVAETEAEVELTLASSGLRHVEYLDGAGALGPDVQLVHAIWLSDAELDRVAESRATVVHCPVSNAVLGSGVAPVSALRRRGVPVALGTDGPSSNNGQDLFETMKLAALLAKAITRDPAALTAHDVLRMATGGGQIAPGCPADLAVVDLDAARLTPLHSPEAALVYAASAANVTGVIAAGRVLLREGNLIGVDEGALLAECRTAAEGLARRLP